MESSSIKIKQVWEWNFYNEMLCINERLDTYHIIAFDTEFPGFLHRTPRHSSEEKVYEDLKYNVDQIKIVQLGLTLFDDEGNIGGTWQVNFYNFVVNEGCQGQFSFQSSPNKDNVEKNGNDSLNKKNRRRRDVVDMLHFSIVFNEILSNDKDLKWVTFHGLYDFAYLWRLLGGQDLPNLISEFSVMLGRVFGSVYDVKYMARFCEGLMDGELELERLSKILEVERLGRGHQAGSDSLLTAGVFLRMKMVYGFEEECFKGFLYGISTRIETSCPILVRFDLCMNYHIMQRPCDAISLPTCLPLPENLIIVQRSYDIILDTYHTIAFDTEFSRFLHRTPRRSSEEKVYKDLKYNVDQTKIVQLGLTLFDDEGNIGGIWQVNFYNFVVNKDYQGQSSFQSSPNKDNIEKNGNNNLNKKNKRRRDAVDMLYFSIVFNEILSNHKDLKWITFHGLYDFAYFWRLLVGQDLPNLTSEFSIMLGRVFGSVYDVKFMARFCEGLMDGELGLEKLSKILEVERLGRAHQAGSDSLLTAGVFLRMKMVYGFEEEYFNGFLYGISTRIETSRPILVRFNLLVNYHVMQHPYNAMSLPPCLSLQENLIIMQRPTI